MQEISSFIISFVFSVCSSLCFLAKYLCSFFKWKILFPFFACSHLFIPACKSFQSFYAGTGKPLLIRTKPTEPECCFGEAFISLGGCDRFTFKNNIHPSLRATEGSVAIQIVFLVAYFMYSSLKESSCLSFPFPYPILLVLLEEKRRFGTSGPLRFKKNDVLRRAYPSASRKTTFWDGRTPPLQEKWRFETSVPLRFKKNDVLGRADPSASRKTTFWGERTPPLPYYKAGTSKFIAFLFVYWMKRWLQLQKSRQLHWQNSIMQNMERLWTPEKLKKILKAVQGLFFIWRGKYG